MSNLNNSINYIELPMLKTAETKEFYAHVFGWEFTDWAQTPLPDWRRVVSSWK